MRMLRSLVTLALVLPMSGVATAATTVVEATDPDRDDYGPGDYIYPVHPYFFRRGVFDLKRFRVRDAGSNWVFEVEVDLATPEPIEARATVARPLMFDQDIFFQNFDIYIRTPDAELKSADGDAAPLHREAVPGRNVRFARGHGWNRAVVITPFPFHVTTLLGDWAPFEETVIPGNVRRIGPRFIARVPKGAIGHSSPDTWRFAVAVSGATPLVQGFVRADDLHTNALTMPIRQNPGRMFFGGGDLSPYNPALIDLLAPTREEQKEMLSADQPGPRREPVELKLFTVEELEASSPRS